MRVRMKDVARAAGVSTATVSLVLSNSPQVNEKTRAHVEKVAEKLGYEPNSHAQRLALKRSGQIGLVVPDIENVYYASLMRHMNIEIQRAGYSMMAAISENSQEVEDRLVREMLRNQIDAVLLVPTHQGGETPPSIERLVRSKTPAIMVTSKYANAALPCIMCNLYSGMHGLAAMLYQQGRRRLRLLSAESSAVAFTLREQGFFDALADTGAHAESAYVDFITYDAAFDWAMRCDLDDTDAILCVNDMMALGVLNALRKRGVQVPRQIAVSGFDDVIFSRITSTPITTVRQDLALLSRLTVDRAVDIIQGGEASGEVLIPCQIVPRTST